MEIDPAQWPALSRLLDEALEVPSNGLEQWLDTLPPPDAVHRNQLRELLRRRAAAETGDFLVTLPRVDRPQKGPTPDGIAPGSVIGPYILEEEIGRGTRTQTKNHSVADQRKCSLGRSLFWIHISNI